METIRPLKDAREEREEKDAISSFSYSTGFTIKGLEKEFITQFKFLARVNNLTNARFLELLLYNYAKNHPEVDNKLTGQVVKLKGELISEHQKLYICGFCGKHNQFGVTECIRCGKSAKRGRK